MAARSNKTDRTRQAQSQPPRPPRPSKQTPPPRRPSRVDVGPAVPDSRLTKKRERAAEPEVIESLVAPEVAAPPEGEPDSKEVTPPKKGPGRPRRKASSEPAQSPSDAPPAAKRKMSLLDSAAFILGRLSSKELAAGIRASELYDRIVKEGLWQTTGRTPHASLYAGMNKEHIDGGNNSRFKRIGPNLFTAGPALKQSKPEELQPAKPQPSSTHSRGKKSRRGGGSGGGEGEA